MTPAQLSIITPYQRKVFKRAHDQYLKQNFVFPENAIKMMPGVSDKEKRFCLYHYKLEAGRMDSFKRQDFIDLYKRLAAIEDEWPEDE